MAYLQSFLLIFIFVTLGSFCNQSGKKTPGISSVKSALIDSSNSFSGKFYGVTPCADCPGIETTVVFLPDSVFIESLKYRERNASFSDTGRWSISSQLITVSFSKGGSERFFLLKNDSSVAMLDANKKQIDGALASFYILKRKE